MLQREVEKREDFKETIRNFLIRRVKNQKRIFIADTTLRDGEQAPGASLDIKEKLIIAKQLDRLGVDSIEAGFPVSSQDDFEAIRIISQRLRRPIITALCRCKYKDIDCAKEALRYARRWGLTLFLGTSPILRKYSVRKSKEDVINTIRDSIAYARKFTDNIAFGAEDASRTEPEFLYKVYTEAIRQGALIIGFADTVGYLIPDEVKDIISRIRTNVPNLDKAFLAVHFHNDLGLAVANALAAVESGVNIIQCTINGIGERAGNTSLEELAIALKVKSKYYKVKLGIDTRELYNTSRLVSQLTGLSISANKAVVGENVFASEAGIHQAALLKRRNTYEIIRPQDVGQDGTKIVLGKHSGRHALINRMKKTGLKLPRRDEEVDRIYHRFKELAGVKKILTDKDLKSIVKDVVKKE